MDNLNRSIIKKLSHLITLAEDGKKGYIHAIKNIREMRKQAAFLDRVSERKIFVSDLKSSVSRLGGSQEIGTPVWAALYREWRGVKMLFTNRNKNMIIRSCIRRDEATLRYYESALNEVNITGDTKLLLNEQHTSIKNALNSIRVFVADSNHTRL